MLFNHECGIKELSFIGHVSMEMPNTQHHPDMIMRMARKESQHRYIDELTMHAVTISVYT